MTNLPTICRFDGVKLPTANLPIESSRAKEFRGELVPQDPRDEPASVLLERIRTAREASAAIKKPGKKRTSRGNAPTTA